MPYKVFKRGGKFKVFKVNQDDEPVGEALGTHDSQGEAQQQVRAIYANENKEWYDRTSGTVVHNLEHTPGSDENKDMGMMMGMPCTFAEMDEMEAAGEMQEEIMDLTGKFKALCDNIMMNPDIEDKSGAIVSLAKEYQGRMKGVKKPGMMKQAIDAVTGLFKQKEAPGLYIWKEGDQYRWIAAYSNNRRDEDDPAEIISSESHKEFDRALEAGEWPMPELWLWHVPYPVGITQFHAYDEKTGFPIAAGVFYKGMDWAAEGIIKAGWNGVSHGMPSVEILRRDPDDPTIITRHRTKEISPLPVWAAANKLAFNIITKENDMSDKQMPAHKLEEFVKAFGAERAAEIQAALEDKAKAADEAGIEKKEATEPVVDAQAETPEAEQPITRDEVIEALNEVLTPVKELAEVVKGLKADIEALKTGQVQAAQEKAEATPAHSLLAMLKAKSVIGLDAAQVDGRSALAKDGPEEAKPEPLSPFGLIDKIKQGNLEYAKQYAGR